VNSRYSFFSFLFIISLASILFSCSREEKLSPIPLPPTPVSTLEEQWGVVTSHLLRVRENPEKGAKILTHLRRGSVVEILTRTTKPEKIENIEGFWYQIDYKGLKGWVFGGYLKEFDSKVEALKYQKGLTGK